MVATIGMGAAIHPTTTPPRLTYMSTFRNGRVLVREEQRGGVDAEGESHGAPTWNYVAGHDAVVAEGRYGLRVNLSQCVFV